MDIQKILQFVADLIDARLDVCDDGFVICIKYPGVRGVDILFDEDGSYGKTIACRSDEEYYNNKAAENLVKMLGLEPDAKGKICTAWGAKTPEGLKESVLAVLRDEEQK